MMSSPNFKAMRALLVLAVALCSVPGRSVAADSFFLVVSARSPVEALTQRDVLALYTGRTRTLPSGETATPLDQPRDGAVRAAFYQALTGMDIARINSYWARLHFTGQVQPPQIVADDNAAIQRLRADHSGIAYLSREPQDPAVRVVLRLP